MSMSDPLKNLGLIWYHSESADIPYFPSQFFALDFFAASYSKMALVLDHTLKSPIQYELPYTLLVLREPDFLS